MTKACDAVVRHIELCTGVSRSSVPIPEKGGNGPLVDLRVKVGLGFSMTPLARRAGSVKKPTRSPTSK